MNRPTARAGNGSGTGTTPLSASREDYLRAMCQMDDEGREITTQALALALGVSPPSVTQMLQRLGRLDLIDYTPSRPVALTAAGRKAALDVVERHELLVDYLVRVLGFSRDQGRAEADRLEHLVSDRLRQRLRERLLREGAPGRGLQAAGGS